MKMRELERRTGVHRETIRVYLRERLLPEPRRSARNVADYDESHVRGVLSIRHLQKEQRLPLARIRRALEGDPAAVPRDPGALAQIERLVSARLGEGEGFVSLASLARRNPCAASDARALQRIGAVQLRRRGGRPALSRADAQLVALWGDMRAAGFTEQLGFEPSVARMYVDAARRLARAEVRAFLEGLAGREETAPAAAMVDAALATMLAFFGLLRTRAVLDAFRERQRGAARSQATKSRAKTRSAVTRTATRGDRSPASQ